ncbi:MAG TPA: CPBP family intramembrane glutamic endopeptidase [Methylibium sp.]|uniref:CPBP family intramembrane glutamic endopeptidase n=1 Tax=Methylibium sp. TaxID=2067992 RepID=UPI002DBA3AC5|nr:CPBP family intramembrane glutamic endopeptidase [Methylibium sp.]HEU4459364.1 CPBP family intramembrane glutamic endopeptidase [Methylibium sp.]
MTFLLLGIAILAVWAPPLRLPHLVPAWWPCFAAALLAAVVEGVVRWPGLLAIALLLACAWGSKRADGAAGALFTAALAGLALAMALHLVPGFRNPVHLAGVRASVDGAGFTQYLNFDKGAAGLVLLAFHGRRGGFPPVRTLLIAGVTVVVTLGLAVALAHVRVDVKWPSYALSFLLINLLFTCVPEEAFFRGLVQERLMAIAARRRAWAGASVVACAALFGLAHLGGGPTAAAIAAVAGLGYAVAYAATRRVEAAVLAHFAVNAVHFIGFTYPHRSA